MRAVFMRALSAPKSTLVPSLPVAHRYAVLPRATCLHHLLLSTPIRTRAAYVTRSGYARLVCRNQNQNQIKPNQMYVYFTIPARSCHGCNLSRSYLPEANGNAVVSPCRTTWARIPRQRKKKEVCRSTPFQLGRGIYGAEIPGFCVP